MSVVVIPRFHLILIPTIFQRGLEEEDSKEGAIRSSFYTVRRMEDIISCHRHPIVLFPFLRDCQRSVKIVDPFF